MSDLPPERPEGESSSPAHAVPPLILTSRLDVAHRDELERLLFYNGNQLKVRRGASLAIERYRAPRVSVEGGRLWVTFDSGIATQCLFAMDRAGPDGRPVGTAVYTREADALAVLLLAVHEDYARGGARAGAMLFARLVDELLCVARRIKGIATVRLFLADPPIALSVRRPR